MTKVLRKTRPATVILAFAMAAVAALAFTATATAAVVTPGAATTTYGVVPFVAGQGNVPDCPTGTFALKAAVEHASTKSYTEAGVTVTVTSANPDDSFFDFSVTSGTVSVVYVKTKPFIDGFDYRAASGEPGPVTGDTGLHGPQEDGVYVDVEHITFCVAPKTVVTAARFGSFTATRAVAGVRLRWTTRSEVDLLGFNVYREQAGKRVRLNRMPIRARGATSGSSYSHMARGGARAHVRYWVQAVTLDGSRTWLGPVRAVS